MIFLRWLLVRVLPYPFIFTVGFILTILIGGLSITTILLGLLIGVAAILIMWGIMIIFHDLKEDYDLYKNKYTR
jgi:hypothetical protein